MNMNWVLAGLISLCFLVLSALALFDLLRYAIKGPQYIIIKDDYFSVPKKSGKAVKFHYKDIQSIEQNNIKGTRFSTFETAQKKITLTHAKFMNKGDYHTALENILSHCADQNETLHSPLVTTTAKAVQKK